MNIAGAVEKCLSDFNIRDKLRFVVTDNASNMRKAFEVLAAMTAEEATEPPELSVLDDDSLWEDMQPSDEEHVNAAMCRTGVKRLSCFAHTLQLVIKDGVEKLGAGRTLISKCCKMANLVHQSIAFREEFEKMFGNSASIPSTNASRWNSLFMQLTSISDLDSQKLANLLMQTSHDKLILTKKESDMLDELVDILAPFAEATDLTQGDKFTTIGCVVPTVVALMKHLTSLLDRASYHRPLVTALHASMLVRFEGLLVNLQMVPQPAGQENLPFDAQIYLIATALDPSWGFRWLECDHPGTEDVKICLKAAIISEF